MDTTTTENENYRQGHALGTRHRERGLAYFLPFGKHVDFVRGYKAGYYALDGE